MKEKLTIKLLLDTAKRFGGDKKAIAKENHKIAMYYAKKIQEIKKRIEELEKEDK